MRMMTGCGSEHHRDRNTQLMRQYMVVEPITRSTQPPCGIRVQEGLVHSILAGKTVAIRSSVEAVQRTAELIDTWVTLEREQRIDLVIRHLTLHKLFARDLQPVRILQMCIETLQDTPSHYTLAFLHDGSSLSRLKTIPPHSREFIV
jgi:hypothetical protein